MFLAEKAEGVLAVCVLLAEKKWGGGGVSWQCVSGGGEMGCLGRVLLAERKGGRFPSSVHLVERSGGVRVVCF